MTDGAVFIAAALVSLATSWLLVSRIERVGRSLAVSEAMLGLLAALAADSPEITSAVTALGRHQQEIGAGVVLGSNSFNLAALLGVGALVAGRIAMHRHVVVLTGAIALWCGAAALLAVVGVLPVDASLGLVLLALVPYAWLAARHGRLPRALPGLPKLRGFLVQAVREEEGEVHVSIDLRRATRADVWMALGALAGVVVASVAMEQSGADLGRRFGVPEIIVGGIVLAAVTSLPNAVAGVYLARRGRGAATLSTAYNSNALNVALGLLLPAAVVGLGSRSGQVVLVTSWFVAMSIVVVALASARGELSRRGGVIVVACYLAFVVTLVATS